MAYTISEKFVPKTCCLF